MASLFTRLFAGKNAYAQKASRAPASSSVTFAPLGTPRWTPRDYASLAREGFMTNPVCYRCVRMVAECVARVPLRLTLDGHRQSEHPVLDLLRQPNATQSGAELIENFVSHLLVSGNGYLEAVTLEENVRELYALRPDRMKVVPGRDGWVAAYQYSAGGKVVTFRQNEEPLAPILHLKMFHPLDDHYGMAPIEAGATSLDIHNAAASWNKALLDNGARPSGALVYSADQGNLSQEQFARLKEELELGFQGARNAGRPMLLEGGLSWKSMSLSPKDMDFLQAKNSAAREIALAFGVPPMLLGIPGDATYSNYAEANRAFWRVSILPLANRLAQSLSAWLQTANQQHWRLEIDQDDIPALAGERAKIWEQANSSSFLTRNEKRALVGYPPLPDGDDRAEAT